MNKEQVYERLELLYCVLQFCSQKKQTFSVWHRMAINQERGQLLNNLDYPDSPLRPVSETLEAKIQTTFKTLLKYNFIPLNNADFNEQP